MSERYVSIVVAAYQAEAFIEQAVASCLAQSHRELEVVVVDDGSTDRTPDLVAAIRDSRVRLVRSEINQGLDVVNNRTLTLARGELIARLDADDLMLPTRIERQVAHLAQHPATGLVGTNAFVVEVGKRRAARLFFHFTDRALHWNLLHHCPLLHPTIMLRRSALPPGGYPSGTRFSHDWALFLAMSRGTRLETLAMPGIIYRRHPGAIGVGQREAQYQSARAVLRRHLNEALGLAIDAKTAAAWVHPWMARELDDASELVMLARRLAPDDADLGAAAPAWDRAGLMRCRRQHVDWLRRLLRAAPRLWPQLGPELVRALGRLARGVVLR